MFPRIRALLLYVLGMAAGAAAFYLVYQGRYHGEKGKFLLVSALVLAIATLLIQIRMSTRPWNAARLARYAVSSAVFTYALLCAVVYAFQNVFIFVPVPGDFSKCAPLQDAGFDIIDTRVGQERVRAYVMRRSDARASLLIFHGNGESACRGWEYTRPLEELKLNFFIVEYPGYQNDSGELSEASYLRNAQAAFDFTAGLRDRQGRALPVFVLGRSLGTGPATFVSSQNVVSALLLISPYTSIRELAPLAMPGLPTSYLNRTSMSSDLWAEAVSAPTLVVHGTADQLIPFWMGEKLSRRFAKLWRFVPVEGANHTSLVDEQKGPGWDAMREFLESH